uniref:Sosondowah ankyrin repeat domain family Cb n=1 Tax=Fundulus heteroclitus TaxID=8078 RepID=A0A3Q2TF19_FUNHE
MAGGFSQDSVADFLRQRGGRVTSSDLVEHFQAAFPQEPRGRAAARSSFKSCVDGVAFVRTESGVKHVCLRRQFRYSAPCSPPDGQVSCRDDAAARAQDTSVFILPGPEHTAAAAQVGPALAPEGLRVAEPGSGSRQRFLSGSPENQEDECSSNEGSCSPTGSRRHFIRAMMDSSPEVRRSVVRRASERTAVTLDPVEHEWMMCASDGEWGSLHRLLSAEPSLVLKRDFVTGFTCLHWAAKHGDAGLMEEIVHFAEQRRLPVSVDVRSNMGYTPLHIAAMHSRMEVLKLLCGAFNADVEIRDYSGRKACQYLAKGVSAEMQDIMGARELSESRGAEPSGGGRWRFSKVLQNNLKPMQLLSLGDGDPAGGDVRLRHKPVRRRSSLGRMKPNLQKIRQRASQIVHSASFRDKRETDESEETPSSESRPKTHFLGF